MDKPGDLTKTLSPLARGEVWVELEPKVLSSDPWIVYFDKFMTEDEVSRYEEHTESLTFFSSTTMQQDGQPVKTATRTSFTANCNPPCNSAEIYQLAERRVSAITGVPQANFETTQATRYEVGGYFKNHHDHAEEFALSPCGARVFTLFAYLTNNGDGQGGDTYFPEVNITVAPKRGAAVLFANTLDKNPHKIDKRTHHESTPVLQGEKRGLNFWMRQHNFIDFWHKRCVSPDEVYPADDSYRQTLPTNEKVIFRSVVPEPLTIFFVHAQNENKIADVPANGEVVVNSFVGHRFRIRKSGSLVLVREYVVEATSANVKPQAVLLREASKAPGEL